MNDFALQSRLDWHLERHLELAATNARLDEELGTHHGLAWPDFVLLSVLDGADGAMPSAELARRLGLVSSRLVLQLLPLEKTGLIAREPGAGGKREVTLRPGGRRLLNEARETAAFVCAEAYRLRDAASLR